MYNSILAQKRKELHKDIAEAIEALHKDDLFDHYEVLSEHFFQSGAYRKAADYSQRSAKKAEKGSSLLDAVNHARKRVLCLNKSLQSGEPGKEMIGARTVLGLYLIQISHPLEAMEAVEPVAQLAREKGYMRRLGQIQTIMGSYYFSVDENLENATNTFERVASNRRRRK